MNENLLTALLDVLQKQVAGGGQYPQNQFVPVLNLSRKMKGPLVVGIDGRDPWFPKV